ncbi:glycine-rich selenoprotein-like [Rhagoletis pomonella]|uniref:glycine-rich selenoprotein-like n=1 Tax=Rhagoletis pomonella TaxID=28610 RepID=UPI00178276BC|nr:glycine-rich selenoprotein-like [Rhagoletis pomonella]
MVYIDRDGRVLERRPWSVARVLEIFISLWFVVVAFFKTLMAPFMNNDNQNGSSNNRRGGWGSGGGGGPGGGGGRGGGSGGGGFNQGLRPNRRIGRVVNTSMDCNIPGGG